MAVANVFKHSPARCHRRPDGPPSSRTRSSTQRAYELDAEVLLHKLLLTLDSTAIARAVKVLAADRQGRRCLQRRALWDRLLVKHFGGRRASNFHSSKASDCSDEDEWSDIDYTSDTFKSNDEAKNAGLNKACEGLGEFLASAEDYKRFQENVLVVKGDIGEITELGGRAIDGIAFPTTANLHNSGTGAAAVVFRRAGDGLATLTRGLNTHWTTGCVRITPGFGAGVNKLIHAVGPSVSDRQCYQLLEATYKSVMVAAQRENLECLALASISTGNLGVPSKEGARTALRAIQQFLSQEKWAGVVGVVCYEQKVFDAFTEEKEAVLEAFNVKPPHPSH